MYPLFFFLDGRQYSPCRKVGNEFRTQQAISSAIFSHTNLSQKRPFYRHFSSVQRSLNDASNRTILVAWVTGVGGVPADIISEAGNWHECAGVIRIIRYD
jgi:hypothetical protein